MNEWLKKFQSSYGALANNTKPKIANLPANYKSTEAAAFKAADAAKLPKAGMKIKDWGPDQWGALASALSPLMEMMQKRRRR